MMYWFGSGMSGWGYAFVIVSMILPPRRTAWACRRPMGSRPSRARVRSPRSRASASLSGNGRLLAREGVSLDGLAQRAAELALTELGVRAVMLTGDKAAKIAELQRQGRRVAMVGDGAPALAQVDVGVDALDVATAITISRGTRRTERQNLAMSGSSYRH